MANATSAIFSSYDRRQVQSSDQPSNEVQTDDRRVKQRYHLQSAQLPLNKRTWFGFMTMDIEGVINDDEQMAEQLKNVQILGLNC